jgi:hypothetical protein
MSTPCPKCSGRISAKREYQNGTITVTDQQGNQTTVYLDSKGKVVKTTAAPAAPVRSPKSKPR